MKLIRKGILSLTLTLCGLIQSLTAQTNPGPRDHVALSYNSVDQSILLFGGNGVDSEGKYTWNSDTWKWDGTSWTKLTTNRPGNIASMSIVFDIAAKKHVMFGGINPAIGDLKDTWIFEEDDWITGESEGPGVRLSPAMAYNPQTESITMFSGCIGNDYTNDTWTLKNGTWTRSDVTAPVGRCRAAMFFDEKRNKIILFGGAANGFNRLNDMWEWDGTQWEEVDQGDVRPSARSNVLMVYDKHRQRAVLYGGNSDNGLLNDLWEWDGEKWHEISTTNSGPGSREIYGMVYHEGLNKTFLYGGRTGFAKPQADLWSWDGKLWEQIH